MSFLVLVIMDRVQMGQVNQLHRTHPYRNKYRLVHYRDKTRTLIDCAESATASTSAKGAPAKAEEPALEFEDDMPIVETYFRHVEQFIYSHQKAEKMLCLDGDLVPHIRPPAVAREFLSLHME